MNQEGIEVVSDFRNLQRDDFLKKYECFFLIKKEGEPENKANKGIAFATIAVGNLEELLAKAKESTLSNKIIEIFPLKKTNKNPFQKKITIGRTTTQDITIDNTSISKYQGHFEYLSSEEISFIDRGSTNGTFINNVKLEPSVNNNVKDGDIISFSGIKYTVYNNRKTFLLLKDTKFDF
ncbi:MAG: FHA domain-containing protein [Candidatus Sericytochromatia bacterium]